MHIFRTYKTRINKETKKRECVLDAKGRKIPHKRWRFEYKDWQGKRRKGIGAATRAETEKLALRVQVEQDEIRKGYRPIPKTSEKHAARPFAEVVVEYLNEGNTHLGRHGKPWGAHHARKRRDHLRWWEAKLGIKTLADLDGILPRFEACLRELQANGPGTRRGKLCQGPCTGKTVQSYRESLCALCDWAVKRGYLDQDPLRHSIGYDQTPQRRRRALDPNEIQRLLTVGRPQWRLLYETAILSGLRASELRSLRVEDLDIERGGLHLSADWTKNRRPGFQNLPRELIDRLAASAESKVEGDPLLEVSAHTAEVLAKDLARAGISKSGPGGVVDFHSLRNTYISLVDQAGGSVKEIMDRARHQSADMSLNTYARSRPGRRVELAEMVGKLVYAEATPTEPQREVVNLGSPIESGGYVGRGDGSSPPPRTKLSRQYPPLLRDPH